MIVYQNPDATSQRTFARFAGRATAGLTRACERALSELLPAGARSALEIAADRGHLLAAVYERSARQGADPDPAAFLGVEPEARLVRAAEAAHGQLSWIQDDFQSFLARSTELALPPDGFDLIVLKPEPSMLSGPDGCRESALAVASLLNPNGVVVLAWQASDFCSWLYSRESPWPSDPFEILRTILGPELRIPQRAHLIRAYGGADAKTPRQEPLFERPIATLRFLDKGKEVDRGYIRNVIAYQESLSTYTRPRWGSLRRHWMDERGLGGKPPSLLRFESGDLESADEDAPAPRVAVPVCRMLFGNKTVNLTRSLMRAARESPLRTRYLPVTLSSCRKICSHLPFLFAADSDVLLLGASAIDHHVDRVTGQPRLDVDEFECRLAWCFERARQRNQAIWYLLPSLGDRDVDDGSCLRSEVTGTFRSCLHGLAEQYPIQLVDFAMESDSRQGPDDRQSRAARREQMAEALLDSLCRAIPGLPQSDRPRVEPAAPATGARYALAESVELVYVDGGTERLAGAAARQVDLATEVFSNRFDGEEAPYSGKALARLGGRNEFERGRQQQIVDWLYRHHRAGLSRAMIIGDSIRMRLANSTGYGVHAYRRLVGKVNLVHVPHNCGGSKAGLFYMQNWLSARPDVVFYNAGLHDLARHTDAAAEYAAYTTVAEYQDNLRAIFQRILESGTRALLWGLNTPVDEEWHRLSPYTGEQRLLARTNSDVRQYNDASRAVAEEFGLEIVDLFTPLWEAGVREVLLPDGVHLNHAGASILGRIVAEAVLSADRSIQRPAPGRSRKTLELHERQPS